MKDGWKDAGLNYSVWLPGIGFGTGPRVPQGRYELVPKASILLNSRATEGESGAQGTVRWFST